MVHLKTINFPFGTNGNVMSLGVSILENFRVATLYGQACTQTLEKGVLQEILKGWCKSWDQLQGCKITFW